MRRSVAGLGWVWLVCAGVAAAQPSPPVVVVGIDAATIEALGPFGGAYRAHHADLIRRLNQLGARGIGFQISFGEQPEYAAETLALARTAAASRAPVVLGLWTEPGTDGALAVEPNADVLRHPRIGEAALATVQELRLPDGVERAREARATGGEVALAAGPHALPAEVDGHPPLFEALALRTRDLRPGQLAAAGLYEEVVTAVDMSRADRLDLRRHRALRPRVADPSALTTLSYVDVLRAPDSHLAQIRGALVVVGITDPQLGGGVPDPDPDQPELRELAGPYLTAFALLRALREVERGAAVVEPAAQPEQDGFLQRLRQSGLTRAGGGDPGARGR